MTALTIPRDLAAHIAQAMRYTEWLRRQVARLELEIQGNPIFQTDEPPTQEQLAALRQTVVLHTYLKQQLLRRERVTIPGGIEVAV